MLFAARRERSMSEPQSDVAKLPVWLTVSASYDMTVGNIRTVLRIAWLPLVFEIAAQSVPYVQFRCIMKRSLGIA